MKKLTMIIFIFLTMSGVALADKEVKKIPEFEVEGYGKVIYAVDIADIQFSVSVRDKDVQKAKKNHDIILSKLQAYFKKEGYPVSAISLKGTILQREKSQSKKLVDDYYLAKSIYVIRTKKLKKLSALQADIVEIGVDEIQFTRLFSSKQVELENEARKSALLDAKKKAQLTASTLGWVIQKPTQVRYVSTSYSNTYTGFGQQSAAGSANAKSASANYIDIKVNVTFSFSSK